MNIENLIKDLNPEQREAVSAELSNMLIIAGAGTGKTRVLVHRIAYLIEHFKVRSNNILAVTFTNKAAAEIKQRLCSFLGNNESRYLWTCTFHSACLRILRNFSEATNLAKDFKVIDTADQLSLVKEAIAELPQLSGLGVNPKEYLHRIMKLKELGIRPNKVIESYGYEICFTDVYCLYQSKCDKANMVDFAELLLRCCELLRTNDVVKKYINAKFCQILVDEFQDTNSIQYEWLNLVKGEKSNVLVVGDDDQSIYGWRGAVVENMHRFVKEYNEVKIIKLERNYRSTSAILGSANSLIKNNTNRLVEKNLVTEKDDVDLVTVIQTENGLAEANLVAKLIQEKLKSGVKANEIAVLYRTNFQSRLLEKSLVNYDIQYRILGGLRFFDREEIKNTLAYLSLIVNLDDNVSFSRIVNVPSRKIGASTLNKINTIATELGISMFSAMEKLAESTKSKPVTNFVKIIQDMRQRLLANEDDLADFARYVLKTSGLDIYYVDKDRKEGSDDNKRTANLDELILDMQSGSYQENTEDLFIENETIDARDQEEVLVNDTSLSEKIQSFLNAISLVPSSEGTDNTETAVQLMTIHCAKGLEFNCVIVSGFEEQLLPLGAIPDNLEEERRLAYVAITRAKKYLYLSYAKHRIRFGSYGDFDSGGPSVFIDEMDHKYYQKKIYIGNY